MIEADYLDQVGLLREHWRVLRDEGPQSRAALSRRAKLSATTLTHVTAQLLREGYIRENETNGAARVGRPAQAVRLVAATASALAPSCDAVLVGVRRPDLNDVFLALTGTALRDGGAA